MSTKKLNLAITGGWSWGHILPLISLLQMIDDTRQYRQVIDNVFWFGEKKGMEYKFFQQYESSFDTLHPKFISILAGKYRRETIWISRWRNLRDMFIFPVGIFQSIYYILSRRIDIVFCKGWYVSLPVVIAARLLRKKIYVHDSDTTPWLTTRFASRFATQNFSGFPDTLRDTLPVGQILSDSLIAKPQHLPFDLPSDKLIVLVAWGSLGSQKLYHGVLEAICDDKFCQEHCFFIFINGKDTIDKKYLPDDTSHILVTDLITEQAVMWYLYAHADLGIVRGGTTTLAECKLFDLPLVIVPLPVTHDQAKNAQYYVEKYQDICISQNNPQFIKLLHTAILKIQIKIFHLTHTKQNPSFKKQKLLFLILCY
jgi:UDP-N-acetylglucosamine--N-acetylmuramyl-(pentapeptide) pyrophosphoryl-undecaprenol N-acetylglucosamine transferase